MIVVRHAVWVHNPRSMRRDYGSSSRVEIVTGGAFDETLRRPLRCYQFNR
jgi:hypothetical protein